MAYNAGTNSGANDLMSGMPAWMRLAYNSGTGAWSAYYSVDGVNWVNPNNRTQSLTPGFFKVSISATLGAAATTVRIGQVIDVLAYGSTDLREAVPSRTRQSVVTINGTDGSLPADYVDDSEGATSGLSWTGAALRFSDDPTLDADRAGWARIRYTGTEYEECGVLLRMSNPGGNSGCYGTLGLIHDLPDISTTPVAATAASRVDGTTDKVTVTVPSGHGLFVNQLIVSSDFADATFNGKWTIVEATATSVSWYDSVNPAASTGAGTITPATRSPIDQYVRGGGYGLEIQSSTTRRPIRIDDPTGTNVGSSIQSTQLDEMPYFWMKNMNGTQYNMASGGIRMFRLERIGRRIRMKEWADAGSLAASLAAEPSTWDYIDAQDEVNDITLGPAFALSHNGQKVAPADLSICEMDVFHMEYYQLLVSSGPTVRIKASGSWQDALTTRAKISGAWEDAAAIQTKSGGSWS